MLKHKRSRLTLAMLLAVASPHVLAAPPIKVLAAGSLTGALTAVIKAYQDKTGEAVQADFGPAGLLLERIEQGESADIFASANMAHPQKLADKGLATPPVIMARNRLCAKALPEFGLTTENFVDRLLDPNVGLGTSTPKADPSGDYTWMMFAKLDKVRPGAEAILQAKAQQLGGGKNNPPVPAGKTATLYFFEQHKINISMGYCSSRQTTPDPTFTIIELPAEAAIRADYGLSVLTSTAPSHDAAYRFALFIMSPQAQSIISQYGFTTVTEAKPNP
jgi:molybdate transport system substrate-binding protein